MASSIKIRTRIQEGVTTIRALIKHPMEFGIREDEKTGEVRPGRYITEVFCTHKDKPVFKANWGPGISKNPYLSFQFRGGEKGDDFEMRWVDNYGQQDELKVSL